MADYHGFEDKRRNIIIGLKEMADCHAVKIKEELSWAQRNGCHTFR
jgi:hypothetical protein